MFGNNRDELCVGLLQEVEQSKPMPGVAGDHETSEEWVNGSMRGVGLAVRSWEPSAVRAKIEDVQMAVEVYGLGEPFVAYVEVVTDYNRKWFRPINDECFTWWRSISRCRCSFSDELRVLIECPAGRTYVVLGVEVVIYEFRLRADRVNWLETSCNAKLEYQETRGALPLSDEVLHVSVQEMGKKGRLQVRRIWKRAFDVIRRLSLHDRESGVRRFQRETGYQLDAFAVKLFEETLAWAELFFPKVEAA